VGTTDSLPGSGSRTELPFTCSIPGTDAARTGFALSGGALKGDEVMSAVAVRALFRSHPVKPAHADVMSRCINACYDCVESCTICADACLSEREISGLVACVRLNLDCAAVCEATGNVVARANKNGHRQLMEAQLATCIAFCRACAAECTLHADMHAHCRVCADACLACATACNDMLSAMRMPA
jgi:hypothetical protein